MLAMAAIDQWSASTLKLEDPAKVVERWNPEEPSQFFWIDDSFGVTQYEDFLVRGWNHVFPHIKSMLQKGAKIVMTSRDYIYNRARKELKESAFPLLKEAKVVIDVHNLTIREKQQILYNHLKLGKQPRGFRSEIKPHLEMVAGHSRFIPETARRLSDPLFTKDLFLDPYYLGQFVEKREEFLQEVLNGLDRDSKAALALIYMRNDRLESPIDLQPSETEALQRLGSTLGGCVFALEALTGSLVLLTQTGGDAVWRFKHPTIGDAFASILVHSPELLGIYIQGSAPEKLITQVTCGDVGIEQAVVVPRVLFSLMLERLSQFPKSKNYKSLFLSTWGGKWALHSFLARRCAKEFLEMYIKANPGCLDEIVKPGLMLSAMAEVGLVVTLNKLGILPEKHREQFIETVSQYAVDGDDLTAMSNKSIRTVFKDEEFDELKERVRLELLPRLEEVRENVELNHRFEEPPEEHMSSLMETFETLTLHFGEDTDAARIIDRQRQYASQWISEHTPEEPKRKPRKLGNLEKSEKPRGGRSIFDDIDDDVSSEQMEVEPS
jgi:hypothetical protein